ncbi:hypothetical protein [Novacetimonas pomaceti]|uniref:hypothetical protein n=1 Tax=Novacetimonas pomaceti TaxID=2021998 RepID=UPI0010582B6F|nr:hypothetical protein [Novacetimonas pomaceti]
MMLAMTWGWSWWRDGGAARDTGNPRARGILSDGGADLSWLCHGDLSWRPLVAISGNAAH